MLNQFPSLSILLSAVLSKIKKEKPPDIGQRMSLKREKNIRSLLNLESGVFKTKREVSENSFIVEQKSTDYFNKAEYFK